MPEVNRMVIRIKKGKDGRVALSCTRADGTTTWQRQKGGQAAFFPKHDLTHYAVETALGLRQGFYGLVSSGWDLSDFGSPWPRGKLPLEAGMSETIVSVFDLERNSGDLATADDLNRRFAEYCAQNNLPLPREFTEEDLARVRVKRGALFAKWDAVQPGDALEIQFEPVTAEASPSGSPSRKRQPSAKSR